MTGKGPREERETIIGWNEDSSTPEPWAAANHWNKELYRWKARGQFDIPKESWTK